MMVTQITIIIIIGVRISGALLHANEKNGAMVIVVDISASI